MRGVDELPPGWESKQAADGRTYYTNHSKKETIWERPTAVAPPPAYSKEESLKVPAPVSVHPVGTVSVALPAAAAAPQSGVQQGGCLSAYRMVFWITAGLGWVVWIFSVSAAGDQHWISLYDYTFGGTKGSNNNCDTYMANDSACSAFEVFVTTQIIATVMCSVTVVLFTVAFFRPFEAQLGSSQVLGMVGAILMTLATFFQILALIFAAKRVKEYNDELGWEAYDNGPTFAVGVAAVVFGFVQALLVFLSFRSAGDGPLLRFVQGQATPRPPAQTVGTRAGTQTTALQLPVSSINPVKGAPPPYGINEA